MSKLKKVHRTGALGMLMAEGGLPTVESISKKPKEKLNTAAGDQYTEINPESARNWHLNDRPESELGDIAAFAKELSEVGQQQPCIVRPIDDEQCKYEIIAGERRWRAAKHAGIKLKVIVKILNDHDAAIVQAAENAQRKDLSDYAKGMSFYALLKQEILKREEIENKLGISTAQVSRLLSFADLPEKLNEAIQDFSLVTARTAAEIRSIANKSQNHIDALVQLAKKISSGMLGANKLQAQVEKLLSTESIDKPITREVHGLNDEHLFTWKQNSNSNVTVTFSKKTLALLESRHRELEHKITEAIEELLYKNQ